MLTETLDEAAGIKQITRGLTNAERDEIHKNNDLIMTRIVSEHFEDRNSACFISSDSFWVYAESLPDAEAVKDIARGIGYVNMHTLKPHVGDGADSSLEKNKCKPHHPAHIPAKTNHLALSLIDKTLFVPIL